MIITKYPEEVERKLAELDKLIAKVYEEETPKNTATELTYENIERAKRIIYERTKTLIDEKVSIINNSYPTYIVNPDNH